MNNKTKNGKTGTRAQDSRHGNTIHGKNPASASQRLSSLSKSEMGGESRKNNRRKIMKLYKRTIGHASSDRQPWEFVINHRAKYGSVKRINSTGQLDCIIDNIPLAELKKLENKYTEEGVFAMAESASFQQ